MAITTKQQRQQRRSEALKLISDGVPPTDAAPTLDNLLDLKQEVAVDNADVASCGFLTNTKVESILGKLKDSQGQYLLSPYGAELGRS